MSRMKSKGYGKWDKRGTNVRQTGRTGHSLESCPTVPMSDETKAVILSHDLVAREMELRWGVERLERLVEPDMGQKFLAQRERFNEAIHKNDEPAIRKHGEAMVRAWKALDKIATEQGAKVIDPNDYWEMRHPRAQEITVRLVRTMEEMPKDAPGDVAYLSAEELLDFVPPLVIKAKQVFPGARVTELKPSETLPDDPIPF